MVKRGKNVCVVGRGQMQPYYHTTSTLLGGKKVCVWWGQGEGEGKGEGRGKFLVE